MSNLPHDLIPLSRAARRIGVHVNALHRWRDAGRLRMWKVVGRWKVSLAEVEALAQPYEPPEKPPSLMRTPRQRDQEEAERYLRSMGFR